MSDRKFIILIMLFAVTSIGLSVALLRVVLLDEMVHSDGCSSMSGGGAPLQSLNLNGN